MPVTHQFCKQEEKRSCGLITQKRSTMPARRIKMLPDARAFDMGMRACTYLSPWLSLSALTDSRYLPGLPV